jgi:hypothetical protein
MDPNTLDLRSHPRIVITDTYGAPERDIGVAVDGSAGRSIDEFVERITAPSVRELCPPLRPVSIKKRQKNEKSACESSPLHPSSGERRHP